MKKISILLFLSILALGCSSDEDNSSSGVPLDFKLTIDGVTANFPTEGGSPGFGAYKKGDIITLVAEYGSYSTSDSVLYMVMEFTTEGKFLTGYLRFNSVSSGNPQYDSFYAFPSHYIQTSDFSFDPATQRIKLKFSGKMYADNKSLTSDSRSIEGEVDTAYNDQGENPFPIVVNNIEQYCRANFNSTPWKARFESPKSSFINEDAYKIEINFANSPTPGSYNFTSASTSNYVKLSKFNTTTATYDYYNVTGVVAYSYREYHGYTYYSFIGTFSFTAVNPNDPSDVIQVTDGVFRSYQAF